MQPGLGNHTGPGAAKTEHVGSGFSSPFAAVVEINSFDAPALILSFPKMFKP